MDSETLLYSFLAFAGTVAAVLTVAALTGRREARVVDRIQSLSSPLAERPPDASPVPAPWVNTIASRFSFRLLEGNSVHREKIQARLMQAGLYSPHSYSLFQFAKLAAMLTPLLIGAGLAVFEILDWRRGLMWSALAGGVLCVVPSFWLDRRKVRRHATLNRALPDAMDLMVTCVEAGLSLEAALQRVTEELRIAHPALAGELSVVQKQIEFGSSPESALRNFADRSDLESVHVLSTLMQQARRFGAGIAEALKSHAEMLRVQREQWAEESAQKASVKILFPTLVFIFPSIFVVLAGPAAIQLQESFRHRPALSAASQSRR